MKSLPLACILTVPLILFGCGSHADSTPSPSAGGFGRAGMVQMLCYTTPTAQVVRISAVFRIRTSTPTIMLEEPWAQQFRVYVAQSNGQEEGASVTCDQVSSKDAEKSKVSELEAQGHRVIETGWVYAGG